MQNSLTIFGEKLLPLEERKFFRAALAQPPGISASSSNLPLDASSDYSECLDPIPEIVVSPEFFFPIEASPGPSTNEISVRPVMDLDWSEFHETSEKFYVFWNSLNNPS